MRPGRKRVVLANLFLFFFSYDFHEVFNAGSRARIAFLSRKLLGKLLCKTRTLFIPKHVSFSEKEREEINLDLFALFVVAHPTSNYESIMISMLIDTRIFDSKEEK